MIFDLKEKEKEAVRITVSNVPLQRGMERKRRQLGSLFSMFHSKEGWREIEKKIKGGMLIFVQTFILSRFMFSHLFTTFLCGNDDL